MKYSSIIDLPRNKNQQDLFGIEKYQEALVEFINCSNTPLTIALQGEWGSGKTSLMNVLDDELCDKGNFYKIWINSWQYSLMKSPEQSVLKIVEGIIEQILKTLKDKNESSETLSKMKDIFKKISISGGKFLAKQVVDTVGGNADFVDDFFNGDGAEGAEISQMKTEIQSLVSKALSDNIKKGFIFFIDDLDRIDPPVAVQILELLKNIFDLDKCIFVLAIDYDVVVKGLEPKFGKLSDKNEREFRSFFDKIIQMPFSMPVTNYTIDVFLIDALLSIGYIDELSIQDDNYKKALSEFASLSVGQNPRALKRLTNTLSLINIINNKKSSETNIDSNEKLICFAMICLQIAYPLVYNKLIQEPDFTEWNIETAIKFRLDKLNEEQLERLNATDEFDEDWEKVLFQICQKETYSSNRAFQISTLLNNVKDFIPKNKEVGEYLTKVLEQSAVTNLQANDSPPVLKTSRADIQNALKEKILNQLPSKFKKPLIDEIKILSKGVESRMEVRVGSSKDQLKKWWHHPIYILVTNKGEQTNFAINFACHRWPNKQNSFLEKSNPLFEGKISEFKNMITKYFGENYDLNEVVTVDDISKSNRVIYQIKANINFEENINSNIFQDKILDFISEWATLTYDFSSKLGF
jgi:hypothetical protein